MNTELIIQNLSLILGKFQSKDLKPIYRTQSLNQTENSDNSAILTASITLREPGTDEESYLEHFYRQHLLAGKVFAKLEVNKLLGINVLDGDEGEHFYQVYTSPNQVVSLYKNNYDDSLLVQVTENSIILTLTLS